jgi:tripartite-type tricarboxylate transporter receptor subunit TctC
MMGGNIDVAFDNVGSIMPRVKSGELRALAVLDEVRSKFMPDVPTMKELGYPTVVSSSTRGIAGPKGMAEPVVAKLRGALSKAMADPEHVSKLENQGLAIKVMVGEEYTKYFLDTHAKARKYTEWAKSRPHR